MRFILINLLILVILERFSHSLFLLRRLRVIWCLRIDDSEVWVNHFALVILTYPGKLRCYSIPPPVDHIELSPGKVSGWLTTYLPASFPQAI